MSVSTVNVEFEIQRGLMCRHFSQAANLYDDAFGVKFSLAIPDPARRKLMLESCFLSDFAFVAKKNDQLLGLAGFNTTKGALTGGGSLQGLVLLLGYFQTLRVVTVFSFFGRKPKEHELVMDVIDSNSLAKRLYAKKGFVVRKTKYSPSLNCTTLGVAKATTMALEISS